SRGRGRGGGCAGWTCVLLDRGSDWLKPWTAQTTRSLCAVGCVGMKEIRGLLTAMATPFAEDGSVDHDAARRLATYLLEHGSHGVVLAGRTGERPHLTKS